MTGFSGFPARAKATAIPRVFFSDVLPLLADDTAAIGVTLYAIDALQSQRGSPRWITSAGLADNGPLQHYLGSGSGDITASIERGLRRAVELAVLLSLPVEREGRRSELYFLNTPADRRGLEAVRSGSAAIEFAIVRDTASITAARSNIFALYEALIGTISPLVADELAEAERLYPAAWLEAAFREAAAQNARSWRYVSRILERWANEGPDHATTAADPAGERYFRGKYGRILRQRLRS